MVNPQAADPALRSQTHTTIYEPDSFIPLARLSWRTAAQDTALAPPLPADWMAQRIAFFDQAQATYSQQHGLAPDDADFLQQTAQAQAGQPAAPRNPVTITWYQCDHLGTPQELTAANGDIVWQASYKTWGNTATVEWVAADGATQTRQLADPATFEHAQIQPLRFQGQYFDAETGLHYNRFRYYDPDVGRFVSNDPIGLAGGANIYLYAFNPVAWVDPLGLNADKLGRNLARDRRALAAGQTPHHIVKENCNQNQHVKNSREILARNNIDIDSAPNGARLWGSANSQVAQPGHPGRTAAKATGNYHGGKHIHGVMNDKLIYQILKNAEKKGLNVESILRDIGQRMESGAWKQNFACCCL